MNWTITNKRGFGACVLLFAVLVGMCAVVAHDLEMRDGALWRLRAPQLPGADQPDGILGADWGQRSGRAVTAGRRGRSQQAGGPAEE